MQEVCRRELKYIISNTEFFGLRKQLQQHIRPDHFSGETGYLVRSLYFDSIRDNDLLDVLDGLEDKSKIRLRFYPAQGFSKGLNLEHKVKSGVNSRKLTLLLTYEEASLIASGDYSQLLHHGTDLAVKLYTRLKLGVYRPKLIVEYRRMAYAYGPNNTRITFDSEITSTGIVSSFFQDKLSGQPILPPGIGVLEVKYDGFLFDHLRKTLDSLDFSMSSNSKYAIGRLVSHF